MCGGRAGRPRGFPELQALIRRQLPVIAQRLSATLDKLQRPQTEAEQYVPAEAWWVALQESYRGQGVEFAEARIAADALLPRSIADSVADNLLQNALGKRQAGLPVSIRVSIACGNTLEFRVSDTGGAVPADVERLLLRAPVRSASGLGIGLYQAARHAEAGGYALALERNRDGEVCFLLSGTARTGSSNERDSVQDDARAGLV